MKKVLALLLVCCACLSTVRVFGAPVTGTKTVGASGDYLTLAAAITDLNANGISGNVIINVPSGYTETAPTGGYLLGSATLNGSTSATSTLTIRKNGITANPVLTAPVGTSTTVDGIFFIQGTDYVTIDGIDLAESAANTTQAQWMEFGYALVKRQAVSPFDGCQYVTIQNCTITMTRTNTISAGIFAGNQVATSNSSLIITATSDAMNNCTFSSNTIKNCNMGIQLKGFGAASPFTLYDQNNTIGGSSTTGNTIQNYAGTVTGAGINLQNQNNATVTYNNINNAAGGGIAATSLLYGVYVQTGSNISVNVSNNTFNLSQGASASSMYEIYLGCNGTGTLNLNANTFTATGGSSGGMYMIYFGSGNSNINVLNNNFYNINVATTSALGLIYTSSAATTVNINCTGNYTSGTATPYVNKTGSGGAFYGYYSNLTTSTAGSTTISNNNLSYITLAGATQFFGLYENNGNATGQTKFMRNNVVSNIITNGSTSYGIGLGGSASQSISNCQVYNINAGAGTIYGLYVATNASTLDTISNCRVSGLTSSGGSAYGIGTGVTYGTLRIYGDTINTISGTALSGSAYGIYQALGTTTEISKNTIYDIFATGTGGAAYGMYLNAGTVTAWNNLVGDIRTPGYTTATANSGTQLVGIYCGAATAYNLYYNTVNINGTSTGANFGSTAVYAATGNATFRNNIFINTSTPNGTGTVAAYRRAGTVLTTYQAASNNNLFYAGVPSTNRVIMYDGTTAYQTLSTYQAAVTPKDASSVTENLTFQSLTGGTSAFLKPSTTIATQIESNGVNIAGFTDDIYGTVRAGNTGYAGTGVAPDLGAVEANYMPLDFSDPAIAYTALTYTCATGNRTFTAAITDLSGVPTSGTLVPRVYYKKGSGSWFSTAGVLSSGTANSGTWTFTILASDMGGLTVGDVVSYFVIAQDVASTPNIGSVPFGAAATDVNTITTYPAPATYPINPALSGSYNVGVGGDFTTITQALSTYSTACLTGAVTFVLTDATYPSEPSYPLTILPSTSASATNTLTIKPATGAGAVAVNLSGTTGSAAIFKFLNAKYVTIDGVNAGGSSLTLTNNNTGTSAVIWLAASATAGSGNSNIALKNMNLIGGVSASTTNLGIVAGLDAASLVTTAGMDNDNITIQGNTFKKMGYTIFTVGTAATSAGGLDNWIISNNIMGPSVYSTTDNIGYNGMLLNNMLNVTVAGNTMQNVGFTSGAAYQIAGMWLQQNINGIVVSGNNFLNMGSSGTGTGTGTNTVLYLGPGVINATITGNNISGVYNTATGGYGARGICVNSGSAASNIIIANNFISDLYGYSSVSGSGWPMGIALEGATGGVKIYYNSVNLFGAHTGLSGVTGAACLYVNSSVAGGLDVRDNLFSNTYDNTSSTTDKGWAIYSVPTSTIFSAIDYNDYYAGAPNVPANIGATDRLTIANIITGFGGNANSTLAQPTFVSNTDLHLQAIAANSPIIAGTPVTGFTTDYDGTTRNAALPVIGAHEVSIPGAPPTILYSPLSAYVCISADRAVTATISNAASGVPVTGSLVPRIYYRKNSGAWFSQPGTLTTGTGTVGTWTFNIVVSDMGGIANNDVVSYYIIAQTNAGIVGSTPGTGLVAANVNTVTTPPTTPNSYIMLLLGGTYTVGSGGNYPTITAAVNAYNNACLSGAVTFVLTDATYPTETYPLTLLPNAGASATNTLTIKPAAGVAVNVTGSASAVAMFKFLNAKYITIDGLNTGGSSLTLTNTNGGTSANIWLAAGSAAGSGNNNIGLKNMTIVGGSNVASANQGIVAGIDGVAPGNTAGMDNDTVTIQGNTFKGMSFALRASGTSGSSAGGLDNWIISNNIIGPSAYSTTDNIGATGIYLISLLNPVITNNTIQNIGLTTSSAASIGIYLGSNITGGVVSQNNINNLTSNALLTGASSTCGMYVGSGVVNTTISGNKIRGVSNVNPTGYGSRGMIVNTAMAASNVTIVNNFISNITSFADVSNSPWPIGLDIDGTSGGINVYNNTVNLGDSYAGKAVASGSASLFINTTGTNLDIRNNIFTNTYDNTSSTTDKGYAIYSAQPITVFSNLNYNDYYVGAPNVLGYLQGSDKLTLADIIAGFSGNANSINAQPTFVSSIDLHLQAIAANSPVISGTPIAAVAKDIDSTTRNAILPVMGAHEVSIPTAPATIAYSPLSAYVCGSADRTVTATISNAATGVPTTGSLVPRIYYRKNSGSWFSRAGTLTTGNGTLGTWTFNIVVSDMGGIINNDMVSYYVIAQTNGGIVGSTPSAGLVATDVNTVTTPPTTPNIYTMLLLGGTYTVGLGGDYPTISAAVNAYNNACLSGAITFVLTDATYPSETYPLTIVANAAASATKTLTIRPAAGVAVNISGSTSAVAMFKLLNAKYITIDGLNIGGSSLTLTNNNTTTTGNTCNIWLAAGSAAGSGNNNIALKNMTIIGGVNSSANNQSIVAGIDGASPTSTAGMDNDTVTIQGNTFTRTGYAIRAIGTAATSAGGLDNWTISNNILGPSAYSATDNIGFNGMFLQSMVNPVISGNTVQFVGLTTSSTQTVGIYFSSNINGAVVTQNDINNVVSVSTGTGASATCGLYLGSAVINTTITRNNIRTIYNPLTSGYGGRGIALNTSNAANVTIANNFISDLYGYSATTNGNWPIGISVGGASGGVNLYYNSVSLSGSHPGVNTSTGSACLFINTTGTGIDVRDNLFSNTYDNSSSTTDKGWAIYCAVANSVFSNINYNDYYAPAPNVPGNIGAVDMPALSDIITGFGGNANSIIAQPSFVSATDLHLQSVAANAPIISGGPLAAVTTDIDGTTRNSTLPVIGAHEVNIPTAPPTITYSPLSSSTCLSANRTVTATISNVATGVPTTGSLVPRIYYRKNSGGWFSQPGSLTTGTSTLGTWSFNIVVSDMGGTVNNDTVKYYIIAQTNTGIVGATPSAGVVAADVNTVTTHATAPNTYVMMLLGGTYNVGVGGDYPTITAALAAYNTGCLSGAVTFRLTDATYPSETYPLTVLANAGASATNTLTIKPGAGAAVNIAGSTSAVAVFKFLNAKYVTLDGVNTGGSSLTLTNNNTTTTGNTVIVWLASGSSAGSGNSNIALKNMTMIGGAGNSTSNQGILAGIDGASPAVTAGMDNDNIIIQGNTMTRVGYTVRALGTAAVSAGGLDNWTISNNIFGPSIYSTTDNIGYNGMFLQNMLNLSITGNTMQNVGYTTGAAYTIAGIYMPQNINGLTISGNTFKNMMSGGTGTGAGANMVLFLGAGVINATISGNDIHSIYNNNTSGYGARGIIVSTGSATSNVTIANNIISDIYGYSGTGNGNWPAGVSIEGTTGGVNMYYNTINMNGGHTGVNSATGSACLIVNATGGAFDIRDNIFSNTYDNTSSATDKGWAIYATVANTQFSSINYNDYYVAAPNVLGYIGSTDRPALSDIIAGFGGNVNSINVPPVFVSATDPHLQLHAGNVPLIAGSAVGGITTDIDGTTRNTPPVIGADEVVIPNCSGMPIAGTVTATVPVGCGTYNSNLNLSGSTFLPGITYQWETSTDNVTYTAVPAATNQAYTANVSSTIYYRATLTCATGGLSATTAGQQLISNTVPAITGTPSACAGSTTTLGATVPGGTWVSGTVAVAAVGSATGIVNSIAAGQTPITYTVTSTGCTTSVVFTVNATPLALDINPGSSAICLNSPAQLLAALHDSVLIGVTVGTHQNVNTTTTYPAPFSQYFGGQRTQFLVLASELTAAGYSSGTSFTSINFPVVSLGSTYTNNSFQVRISPTAVTALTAFVGTGLVTVHNPAPYTPVVGDNIIPFDVPYSWDGTSNLIFDVTFSNNAVGSTTKSAIQYNTSTSYQAVLVNRNDNVTAAAEASATTLSYALNTRPDFVLTARKALPVTWASTPGLFTDASASIPYSGSASGTVYALPAATTTYTATSTYNGCTSTATATVTVNPLPAAIAGANTVCVGSTTTLTNDTTGGTWTSNIPATASVGAATGVVTGVAAGVVNMTYTKTATGCFKTMTMTVNPLPAAITGTTGVCESATTTLADADAGGTWSSDAASVATVGSATGVVTGVSAGFAQMTYTLPTSCSAMQQVTVNPVPAVSVSPAPVPAICLGGSVALTASSTMNNFALMSQDFNGGLGAWTITNISGNATSYWQLRASPGYSGTTGDGSQMIQAAPDAYTGITSAWVTSPSFATMGYGAVTLSFNEYLLSLSSADDTVAVEYSTDGGTSWSPVLDQRDAIVGSGSWSSSAPEVSVVLPAGAVGQPDVKLRWNYYSNQGLWWGVDNIKVSAAQPAPSYVWSGVSGASGLSCTACTSVDVMPAAAGANGYSVVATTTRGCVNSATTTVSVNPLPSAIGGTLVVCEGLTTTATDADAGGTWATAPTSIATIGAATGLVTGVSAGTGEITYTLPTGCITNAIITVNPLPAAIDGVVPVCRGLTTTLSDVDAGGTWSSSNTAIAGIDASGVVTGVSDGSAIITYTLPTGCIMTAVMTINPLPAAIGGTPLVCEGLTITLTDADAGGTWVSSSSAIADIGSATGVVTGNSTGTSEVTYTLPTGCIATAMVTVNHTPVAIGGALQACEGNTSTLNNADAAGTWSSSASSIAGISGGGVVSAILAGTATITYALPDGCITTSVFTVNTMPASIGGTQIVCQGVTTTLNDAITGGTWTSGNTSIATVGSASGVVLGVSAGIVPITYTMPGGCYISAQVTVNSSPAAIGGTPQVCIGSVITLTDADPGGTWSGSVAAVASISSAGVVSGLGMGTTTITYALSAGCQVTTVVTVDPLPAPIAGPSQLCVNATATFTNGTPGGTWTSSTMAVGTVDNITGVAAAIASGTTLISYTSAAGCVRTRVLTVNALPAVITGPSELCLSTTITLTDATTGGSWSSGAGAIATISAAGILSGVSNGAAPITYTLPTGCIATASVTVDPLPSAIGGTASICQEQTTTLSNTSGGGTWSSSVPANATVDAATGIVTGLGAGTSFITYTLPAGCSRSIIVTVNAMPAAITGAANVCQGATTSMTTASAGGVWTSAATSVASINLVTGVVTGLAAGTANISYTIPSSGCYATHAITVDAIPAALTGSLSVCSGHTTALGSTPAGGTWSSSNLAVATVVASGVVSGVTAGTSAITYTLPSGCLRGVIVSVNALPTAYNITGGGNYCSGGPGVHIGLDNSNGGIIYQLYSGSGAIGGPVAGITGMAIDFGLIAPTGTYSVAAASATTGCSGNMTGAATVAITTSVPASVSFSSGAGGDTVCSGLPATFMAVAGNGGAAPAYQWLVNGTVVTSATTNIYTYIPAAGDVVVVNMSSSIMCATPAIATASRTLILSSSVMPVTTMTVMPGASICEGNLATFTASAIYGGSSPVYTWVKNGAVAAFGPVYSYIPADGDNILVKLAGNHACALADTVLSSIVTLTVSPVYLPVVNITVTPGTMVQTGTIVSMTATVTNGGPLPEYQWYIGSSAVPGATGTTFTYDLYADGDSVSCAVKGTGVCGLPGFNSVIMHIGETGVGIAGGLTDVRLMPNPNKGDFIISGKLASADDRELEAEVTDMLGQVVYKEKITVHNGNIKERILLNNTLANGMYMLNLRSANDHKIFHFVLEQ